MTRLARGAGVGICGLGATALVWCYLALTEDAGSEAEPWHVGLVVTAAITVIALGAIEARRPRPVVLVAGALLALAVLLAILAIVGGS